MRGDRSISRFGTRARRPAARWVGAPALAAILLLGGCATTPEPVDALAGVHEAVAIVTPVGGSSVRGIVLFSDVEGGVRVVAEIEGLDADALHAFHIHALGDARASDAMSAGDHYDPLGTAHHDRENAPRPHHAGDLGNLQTDGLGRARYDRVIGGISVAQREAPIVGRSVIIHAKVDQFTQPTGGAGARIGIGIIGIAGPGGE